MLQYYWLSKLKQQFMAWQQQFLKTVLELCCDKTYGTMAEYDGGDDDGDNDRNEVRNDDDNATARSGSDGPIFDMITTPRLGLGLTGQDQATDATFLW